EASSDLRLDSRPAAEPSGQMLDAKETLEHGGSRRTDPHLEIVIEGHSGPADVLCQVESKAEDKVAAVTFYGRFPSSRRRAARRPFRPPWRNRFSLGRSPFPGRLDARSPRRGECPTREAPVPPRGLCSVLGRRPQRQLPLRLLRMSCRAVGFAPCCADAEPYERAGMRGHGLL